jgi:ABC-type glycerol-3-phosphate transport system substrate-binding protein
MTKMTHIRTLSLIAIAALTLSACGMSEGIDADSDEDVFTITHTTKGTVYWQ